MKKGIYPLTMLLILMMLATGCPPPKPHPPVIDYFMPEPSCVTPGGTTYWKYQVQNVAAVEIPPFPSKSSGGISPWSDTIQQDNIQTMY